MARVLITGVAGFIGMHTCLRFLRANWQVVGLDNLNNYYARQLKDLRLNEIKRDPNAANFSFHERDLNSNIWDDIVGEHFDAVIHLAAQAGVRYSIENPSAYLESNILGFQRVLDFVQELPRDVRFVYASSSSVYGKNSPQPFHESHACNSPESYYAATKKANEMMAYSYYKTSKLPSIGLRFFTVYGPWGRPDMAPILFAEAANNGNQIEVYNFGRQRRDFTYVDDVVESIFRLITQCEFPRAAEVCNIGFGSPTNLLDFIHLVETNVGKPLRRKLVEAQPGDVEETFADTTKLQQLIKFKPKVSIEEGVKEFISWYMCYHHQYGP